MVIYIYLLHKMAVDAVEIAQYYTSMCNVVDNIKAGKPESMQDNEWIVHRERNVAWWQSMVDTQNHWSEEEMAVVNNFLALE